MLVTASAIILWTLKRAANITDPQLRAGFLSVAKRYRDLAKQTVCNMLAGA